MTNASLRLGIIGTGLAVEKLHWPALTELSDRFTITAFADVDRLHAEHFAAYSGASMDNWSADYRDVLDRTDVDAILISLPIPEQAQAIIDALDAGKHVLSEKPPAAYQPEVQPVIDAESAHPDQVLLIGENYFYRDDVRLAKQIVDSGRLGRVHLMVCRKVSQLIPEEGGFSGTPWRWQANYAGGPHLDAGVHDTAKIRMLMGDVARLSAETQDANATHGGPSDLVTSLRFLNTAAGSYVASYPEHPTPDEDNDLRIYGTEATLVLGDREVSVIDADGTETWSFPKSDGGYVGEFLNFHEAVTAGEPVVGTLDESVRGMEIITAALAAAETGETQQMAEGPIPLSERPLPLWLPAGQTTFDPGVTSKRRATS